MTSTTMNQLFTIRNLKCRYPGAAHSVLEIDSFDIYQGELIFFLGVSGVGKSTLIESLGLMNRTVTADAGTELLYHGLGQPLSLIDLWQSRSHELPRFRAEQYSFIFQSTNLFERVSLHSNAIMPALAGGGETESMSERARELAKDLLQNITQDEYNHKMAGAISGGQKQRLAFIQAMVSPHEVLFGDEPTGNLDWGNAQKVMRTLQAHIRSNNKTGLVVSHDVHLSTAFADRIVLMTGKPTLGDPTRQTGQILTENVFTRLGESWEYTAGRLSTETLKNKLMAHFEQQAC
jgi:ABC-type lipoprotein export system ATPase subunit